MEEPERPIDDIRVELETVLIFDKTQVSRLLFEYEQAIEWHKWQFRDMLKEHRATVN